MKTTAPLIPWPLADFSEHVLSLHMGRGGLYLAYLGVWGLNGDTIQFSSISGAAAAAAIQLFKMESQRDAMIRVHQTKRPNLAKNRLQLQRVLLPENIVIFCRGKKSIHQHHGTALCSVCRPTPRSQSKKKLWCIPFSWENKGKGYTP